MGLYTLTFICPDGSMLTAPDYWPFQVWAMAERMIPAGYQVSVESQDGTSYPMRSCLY